MIIRFQQFIQKSLTEGTMSATGTQGLRHALKYVHPFHGGKQKNTHTLAIPHEGLKKGTPLTVLSSKLIGGRHHTVASAGGKKYTIPNTRINKPKGFVVNRGTAGLQAESKLINHLKKHELMDKSVKGAGYNSKGVDFYIRHSKGHTFGGQERNQIGGESKISLKAKFGAMGIMHDPAKGGWHIPDKNRQAKPNLAASIDKIKMNGKPLMQHLNENFHPQKERYQQIRTPKTNDLSSLHGYIRDHGVDVLHVHSHGTFRAGMSEHRDRTGVGFPAPKGEGHYRIETRPGKGTQVEFRLNSLEKSHLDLMNKEHIPHIKKSLGYKV